eukprot:TRINITY_DN757_c0_g1_i1.p1 TRINITY_DN757_c0_g1~~TRINITY_DN757_c0_g1_i1.p1  ORF type:complete len:290 (-),score=36.34 TRINITY_DN757_c0_g1_i1:154-1023(-)
MSTTTTTTATVFEADDEVQTKVFTKFIENGRSPTLATREAGMLCRKWKEMGLEGNDAYLDFMNTPLEHPSELADDSDMDIDDQTEMNQGNGPAPTASSNGPTVTNRAPNNNATNGSRVSATRKQKLSKIQRSSLFSKLTSHKIAMDESAKKANKFRGQFSCASRELYTATVGCPHQLKRIQEASVALDVCQDKKLAETNREELAKLSEKAAEAIKQLQQSLDTMTKASNQVNVANERFNKHFKDYSEHKAAHDKIDEEVTNYGADKEERTVEGEDEYDKARRAARNAST